MIPGGPLLFTWASEKPIHIDELGLIVSAYGKSCSSASARGRPGWLNIIRRELTASSSPRPEFPTLVAGELSLSPRNPADDVVDHLAGVAAKTSSMSFDSI